MEKLSDAESTPSSRAGSTVSGVVRDLEMVSHLHVSGASEGRPQAQWRAVHLRSLLRSHFPGGGGRGGDRAMSGGRQAGSSPAAFKDAFG